MKNRFISEAISDDALVRQYAIRYESELYGATEDEFNRFLKSKRLGLDKLPSEEAERLRDILRLAWERLKE